MAKNIGFCYGYCGQLSGACRAPDCGGDKNQAEELIHVSNLYWNPPMIELADRLCAASGMDRVFFSNSGTEANETALKIARKYGKAKGGERKSKIICMKESFHGRS